jgi:hypothetical protein
VGWSVGLLPSLGLLVWLGSGEAAIDPRRAVLLAGWALPVLCLVSLAFWRCCPWCYRSPTDLTRLHGLGSLLATIASILCLHLLRPLAPP